MNLSIFKYFLIYLVVTVHVALGAEKRIEIDTLADLISIPGMVFDCAQGYKEESALFTCPGTENDVAIPVEDLNGELGFWTGCGQECILTYRLSPSDLWFGFRAYLKNMRITVSQNNRVIQHITGEKWITVENRLDVDTTFNVSLHLLQSSGTGFVILDKITIIQQDDDTTTSTPPITTSLSTTLGTSTSSPPNQILIDKEDDIPPDGRWVFNCASGYAVEVEDYTSSNCDYADEVSIPADKLSGQQGFWTSCLYSRTNCYIGYRVQPEDVSINITFYQSGETDPMYISYDNRTTWRAWPEATIYNWNYYYENLTLYSSEFFFLKFSHYSPIKFSLLDKIVVEKRTT